MKGLRRSTRLLSMELSFLFVVVLGNNTEKNMETLNPVVNNYAQWLAYAAKLGFNFYYEQLLPIFKTWDRVLSHMRPQDKIYQMGCAIFKRCIEPMIWTALASTGVDCKSQGKSEFPAILQPMFTQFKGYLANLDAITNEIVSVINEIEGKVRYLF